MTQIDPQEFELPETVFSRDINNHVFHGIVEKTLERISGVALQGETLIDQMIGRPEKFRGIAATQDPATQSIKVQLELSVTYGTNIPQKAEEIQTAVAEDLTKFTGLHVSEVHVIFSDLLHENSFGQSKLTPSLSEVIGTTIQEEFEDDF